MTPPLVLIVEDDLEIRESMRDVLTDEGYAVETAADGAIALEMLRGGLQPAVILLDLMMPVMDGWQFRTMQKSDPSLATIPVAVVTAAGQAARESIDVDRFLIKPVRLDALLATVEELTRR